MVNHLEKVIKTGFLKIKFYCYEKILIQYKKNKFRDQKYIQYDYNLWKITHLDVKN